MPDTPAGTDYRRAVALVALFDAVDGLVRDGDLPAHAMARLAGPLDEARRFVPDAAGEADGHV